MAEPGGIVIAAFERAFDDLFEELLISRWGCGSGVAAQRQALVLDLGSRYEVRLRLGLAQPHEVHVETTDRLLTIRVRQVGARIVMHRFEFVEPIDRDAVSAHWSDNVLRVELPKREPAHIASKPSSAD